MLRDPRRKFKHPLASPPLNRMLIRDCNSLAKLFSARMFPWSSLLAQSSQR